MFKRSPQFKSLCPYFWFTVFCAFCLPFRLVWMALYYGVGLVAVIIGVVLVSLYTYVRPIRWALRVFTEEFWERRRAKKLTPLQAYHLFKILQQRNNVFDAYVRNTYDDKLSISFTEELEVQRVFDYWKELHTETWQALLDEGRAAWLEWWPKERERRIEAAMRSADRRDKFYAFAAGFGKVLGYSALALVGIGVGVFFVMKPWHALGVGVGSVVGILGILLTAFIKDKLSKRPPREVVESDEPGLLTHYFYAAKNKVCPMIEWREKT